MRIRIAVPDRHVTPEVLNAALEATTLANQAMLANGEAEPISELINRGHVKWKPEPFTDGEHFDLSDTVHRRGWGDCDDLSSALSAELRESGRDPGARAIVQRSGPKLWHAVTQLSDGSILDPSEAAGMKKKASVNGYASVPSSLHGTSVMSTVGDGNVLGIKPHRGGWASRCDLPVDGAPLSICGVHLGRTPFEAITGAVRAASVVGNASGMVHPEDVARAMAVQSVCAGMHPDELREAVAGYIDGDEVGSFFGKIAHGLGHLVPAAASFLPFPGANLAASALTHMIPGTREHQAAQAALHAQGAAAGAPGLVPEEDWALKIRKGVHLSRAPNGAFVVRF